MIGGGHTWPSEGSVPPKRIIGRTNKDMVATDKIVRFFLSLRQGAYGKLERVSADQIGMQADAGGQSCYDHVIFWRMAKAVLILPGTARICIPLLIHWLSKHWPFGSTIVNLWGRAWLLHALG